MGQSRGRIPDKSNRDGQRARTAAQPEASEAIEQPYKTDTTWIYTYNTIRRIHTLKIDPSCKSYCWWLVRISLTTLQFQAKHSTFESRLQGSQSKTKTGRHDRQTRHTHTHTRTHTRTHTHVHTHVHTHDTHTRHTHTCAHTHIHTHTHTRTHIC